MLDVADGDGIAVHLLGVSESRLLRGVECDERVAFLDFVAVLLVQDEACREVDIALLRLAASAEHDGRLADLLGVHLRDEARTLSLDLGAVRCLLELRVVAQDAVVAALGADHRAERLEGTAVSNRLLSHRAAFLRRALADEIEHVGGELQRYLAQVSWALALEDVHRLHDLDAVADAVAERRVHVGDQGDRAAAGELADGDHRLRELDGVIERLHEGTTARLDIEQDAVGAGGELLAHDRRGNQRDAVDCRRDIAQRVELLVGRREVARLSDDADAALVDRVEELLARERRLVARDRLELVDCAARVATLPPQAATIGAQISVVLSPTPPVECLSTFLPAMAERSIMSPDLAMTFVSSVIS